MSRPHRESLSFILRTGHFVDNSMVDAEVGDAAVSIQRRCRSAPTRLQSGGHITSALLSHRRGATRRELAARSL